MQIYAVVIFASIFLFLSTPYLQACLAQASGMAAFDSATNQLVSWLNALLHASEWVAGQKIQLQHLAQLCPSNPQAAS
jgi:hypothetical protein